MPPGITEPPCRQHLLTTLTRQAKLRLAYPGGKPSMSHVVTIQTKLHDPAALAAACRRLNLAAPAEGTAKLFSGEATGLLVQLPGWQYPAVVDVLTGTVRYDNYEGRWGEPRELHKFLQAYAVEKARLEARKKGHTITEQQLQDGSIRLQISEG